jgi:hypothetical protein
LDNALQFSQNIYEGTARFQAMGGAFAALGGDFTSLSINPAGVAVYRSSEVSFTPALAIAGTSAGYMGNTIDDSKTRFGLGSIGYVSAFPTYNIEGLMSVNFGIGFNKLQNNTQRFSAGARTSRDASLSYLRHLAMGLSTDNISEADFETRATDEEWLAMTTGLLAHIENHDGNYIGATEAFHPQYRDSLDLIYQMGDIDQLLYRNQSGYVGEYTFSTGINLSDLFYFGLSLGVQEINHSLYEEYQEKAVNMADFDEANGGVGFQRLIYTYNNETKGIGYNLKFGAITRPIGGLRVGAYIHTPTWMFLHEHWTKDMTSVLKSGKYDANIAPSDYYYRVQAPFRWGAGLAYTFGSIGLISVDYEGVGYSGLKLREDNGSFGSFVGDNRYLDDYYRSTTTNIRVGGELRLNAIALRAGYAYYQNPGKEMKAIQIGSVGIGYRGEYFFIDGAYSFSPDNTQLRDLYAGNPNIVSTSTFLSKIAITIGWRF